MVVAVTLNASVDKLYQVEHAALGSVMRVQKVINTAGGKGLNVARALHKAGVPVTATGLAGGFNGGYIRQMLVQEGISHSFLEISGEARSCINVLDRASGQHTEYLEPGEPVTAEILEAFVQHFSGLLAQCSVVTLSGSVPQETPVEFYTKLVKLAKQAGCRVILDTSGPLLEKNLASLPTMIKPNTEELAQMMGQPVNTERDIAQSALALHATGIPMVVVSRGAQGALVATNNAVYKGGIPPIQAANTVGCGDTMVAGFAAGMAGQKSTEECIRMGLAFSCASAMREKTGDFTMRDMHSMLQKVTVEAFEM